jgi:Uma2 family endonuclease
VPDHQLIAGLLACALEAKVPDEYQILQGPNLLRRGNTDRLLIPDVTIVDQSGMQRARKEESAYLVPEEVSLAVEIISPSSRTVDLSTKRDFYMEWGIPTYWVLDPKTQEIHEFGLADSVQTWLSEVDLTSVWP